MQKQFSYFDHFESAVTICDREARVVYMNEKSRATFGGRDLVGQSLFDCHQQRSSELIRELLSSGRSNTYTIEKKGLKKLIHQAPWRDASGAVAGLIEISIVLPENMPHHVRS